jgi:hypothetical protein
MAFWFNGCTHHRRGLGSWGIAASVIADPRSILEDLLLSYVDIFEEPRGLPPEHCHDHCIHLALGSPPISVQPYRYP